MKTRLYLWVLLIIGCLAAGLVVPAQAEAGDYSIDFVTLSVTCGADAQGWNGGNYSYSFHYHLATSAVLYEGNFIGIGGDYGYWIAPFKDFTEPTANGDLYEYPLTFPYTIDFDLAIFARTKDTDGDGYPHGEQLDGVSAHAVCTQEGPAAITISHGPVDARPGVGGVVGNIDSSAKSGVGFNPGDGRINVDAGAPVALYCVGGDLQAYAIDDQSRGSLALLVPQKDFSGAAPPQNTLLGSTPTGNIAVYRLTTGELQVNALYAKEDKWYVFTWDACPPTEWHHPSW